MIKTILLSVFAVFLAPSLLLGQTQYLQDFGSSTGTYNTASGSSTTFLPAVGNGTQYVRMGSTGGSHVMETSTIGAGGMQYRITAPTSASINKWAIHTITGATQSFILRFKVRFEYSATLSGEYILIIGNSGTSFTTVGNAFAGAQTFTGLSFKYKAGQGGIAVSNRNVAAWDSTTNTSLRDAFSVNTTYTVDIFCNDSSGSKSYNYNSTPTSVGAGKYDIYVDGTLVGDEMAKAQLAAGTNIDGFMVYGQNSTSNSASVIFDDVYYKNGILSNGNPLPVELEAFSALKAGNAVTLTWKTATESNNYGFDIERRRIADAANDSPENGLAGWKKVGFAAGAGTSNSPRQYSYTDNTVAGGTYAYRLKQIDNGGDYKYYYSNEVDFGVPADFILLQNYPNPFNPTTTIEFALPYESNVTVELFTVAGQKVRDLFNGSHPAGYHTIAINASDLSSGLYYYRLTAGSFVQTRKMMLVK